jgi:hypothetical protein
MKGRTTMKRLLFLIGLGCVSGVLLVLAAPAAANGDVTCTGFAPAIVPHDLIVPAGGSCTILPGTTVGHDVVVNAGATLVDSAGMISHDIKADKPASIGIGGSGPAPAGSGSVGHDVQINGITGGGPGGFGDNYVCNTKIGHDLTIQNSLAGAGFWLVGHPAECTGGAVTVGHDLVAQNNANFVDVGTNAPPRGGIGHDLTVQNNPGGAFVFSNSAGHDATCQNNTPFGGFGNTAGHNNTCG